MSLYKSLWVLALCTLASTLGSLAEQCGRQAGGALCPGRQCCSQFGFCGSTPDYCSNNCQSQCISGATGLPSTPSIPIPTPSGDGDGNGDGPHAISFLISQKLFEPMLNHRNDDVCPAKGFYTYKAFIAAAKSFPTFGITGNTTTRKREIAAFLAQTSHETTGGWAAAPDGPYAWGYCFNEEQGDPADYCVPSQEWPCLPGKHLKKDLLSDPDGVAKDAILSFKTALWFWMTPLSLKPSCHDVIIGKWKPSAADKRANRIPGYGVTTNIINGGIECGRGSNPEMENRIGFYKRYCHILGVGYGDNLDCSNQRPFNGYLIQQ